MRDIWPLPGSVWRPLAPAAGSRIRFFELGEVRLAVLSLLEGGPNHGYQLMKELATRLGKLYRASSGTVYPVLQQLEKENLVAWRLDHGRKMYSLTKAGCKVLAAETDAVKGIWTRAEELEDLGQQWGPHSMAVAGPLAELVTATLRAAAWSAGDPNREDRIRGILRNASTELYKLAGRGKTVAER